MARLMELLAEELGVSCLTAQAMACAGVPGTESLSLGPFVNSKAAVGAALGVSERTVSTWLAEKGCPGRTEHGYSLPHVRMWRLEQTDADPIDINARLLVGLLTAIRGRVAYVLDSVETQDRTAEELLSVLVQRFAETLPTDEATEQLARELLVSGTFRNFDAISLFSS